MRTRLQSLSFLLVFLLVVGMVAGLLSYSWISLSVSVALLAVSFLMARYWMKYIQFLIEQTNKVLNKKEAPPTWSLQNLELLPQNQDLILKKIKSSAEIISNLSHPEKLATINLDTTDSIGKALHTIKGEMQKMKEEDERRAWVTQGLAQFGEVLRKKAEVKEYGYQIISHLVKYIQANQGALYLELTTQEGERYLEMVSSYAYGKRKYVEQRIALSEGLLGQCMLEKDFIFITDVPKNYVKITSGLGEATPRNVIVAPLIFNDTFCGAIELAAFEVLQSHQREFLEKVCVSIASEMVALKNMQHTQQLLEESNSLTQELQSREEEMKQNLEELAATQEEMSRKQNELSGVIHAIDSTLATAEFDTSGNLTKYNSILINIFGKKEEFLKNKDFRLITGHQDEVEWYQILKGEINSGDFQTRSATGLDVWLSVTFTAITDANNKPVKILSMIQDITQKKLKEKEFERLSLVANNTDNSVIITDRNRLIEYVNAGFTKMTGYEFHEVVGKKPGSLLQGPLTDKKVVAKLRESIAAGVPIYEEILNYNKKGETYWVSLAINPVKDEEGNVSKYISIQADITETKVEATDFHQKMEALSRSNAIIELDTKGNLIDINDNYLEMLGYERDEVIGRPYSLLTRKENVFEKLMTTIKSSGIQSGVFNRFDKAGNRHSVKLMDYPVLNLNGEIEKIIEFGVDVSNEFRLQREAERKQAELDSYLSGINNTIASAEFSLDGYFKDANEIFLKVMGFAKEDLVGRNFDFLMGEDQSTIMMWENLRLGKFFSGEFKMKNKEGKELWLSGTFNPITIEKDIPEKILMFAQFTTQEKEKLNDLNALVHALKSTLPVLEFNPDFVCKTANEKALKIFGLSRLQLRSKTILDFLAPGYHSMWNKNQKEILDNDFVSFTLPFKTGNHVLNYEVSVSVSRHMDGTIAKVIMILVREVADRVSFLAAV